MIIGRTWWLGAVLVLLSTSAWAAKDKDKNKEAANQTVDSGSFGIFVNGQRVATEAFNIQQNSSGSVATSQFKTEGAAGNAIQTSELQLTATGNLVRYEWKEVSPGKSSAVVTPDGEFLIGRYTESADAKPLAQPFLLPASTSVLDDYFFIQREIMVWKFLAMTCRQKDGKVECPANQRTQFGTLNPHDRSSVSVNVEFVGREKVPIRGAEQELNRLNIKSDNGNWALWLDDQFKLMRILVENTTEVVRD